MGRTVVYLHVGAPKTGTTYLQNVLARNRPALRRDGVLYPGDRADHFFPAQDLLGWHFGGWRNPAAEGAWGRLVAEAHAWGGGTVLLSHEMFSAAEPHVVDRAVADLEPAEVHLIYTARDLARMIPAAWQEDVKNRWTATFGEALDHLREGAGSAHPPAADFWRRQDPSNVFERWGRAVPADRMHVVTVPGAGAPQDLFWERFASVVGLDPTRYTTQVSAANPSLGAAETAVIRRLTAALDSDVPWDSYHALVKHHLAHQVLAHRPDPIPISLPPEHRPWVEKRAGQIVEWLETSGVNVVGDLNELIPERAPERHTSPDDVPADLELAAAADALAGLVRRAHRLQTQLDRVRADRDRLRARRQVLPVARALRWAGNKGANRYRSVAAARRAYLRFRETVSR
ncbi:MAG: hypothetical protein ACRDPT_16265 [Streptomycetales bacterium]